MGKLLRIVVPIAVVVGLYLYGRTLPPGTSSSRGASAAFARVDRPDCTIDVQRVGSSSNGYLIDVRIIAKRALQVTAIEGQAGDFDRKGNRFGGGEQVYVTEAGQSVHIAAGQTRTIRGDVPVSTRLDVRDTYLRTTVRFAHGLPTAIVDLALR